MIKKIKFYFIIPFVMFLLATISGCNVFLDKFYSDPEKCFRMAEKQKPFDAIIVPGFPYDSAKDNMMLKERAIWAHYLYQNGFAKHIIFSGAATHTAFVEAEILRLYALQLGIPDSVIFKETKAEHSTENLYYSATLARKKGFKTLAFATQPAQASFMKAFSRKWELDVEMLPLLYSCLNKSDFNISPIDASSAFIPNFTPLKDRESKLRSLRGTGGQRVRAERRKVKREEQELYTQEKVIETKSN